MPFYRFEIDAPMPVRTVVERLRSATGPDTYPSNLRSGAFASNPFGMGGQQALGSPFVGSVGDDSFRIRRSINYRNSFLPVLRGRIESAPSGARVCVTMVMHPFVLIFMFVWLFFVGRGAFNPNTPDHLLLLGMFSFGVILPAAGFVPEVGRAKGLLSAVILHPETLAWQESVK